MGVSINNKSTTTEQPPYNGSLSHGGGGGGGEGGGGLNACYWYQIFDLDSSVVEVQGMFSSQVSSKNVTSLYKIVSSVS